MARQSYHSMRVAALGGLLATGFGVATSLAATKAGGDAAGSVTALPALTTTIAGEPLAYPNTPAPVVSSSIVSVPPGGVTEWMTHPVQAYLYVLEGTLTVEFA